MSIVYEQSVIDIGPGIAGCRSMKIGQFQLGVFDIF